MKMSSFFYQVLQSMVHQWNEIDRGKPTTRRKTSPSATLSTTNLTWTDPGSNPGLRGERPATNRLSHGTAGILSLLNTTYAWLGECMHLYSWSDRRVEKFDVMKKLITVTVPQILLRL
jgi:hypothetical protein